MQLASYLERQMDGQTTNERTDRWADNLMYNRIDKQSIDRHTDGWMDGERNGWTDRQMYKQKDSQLQVNGATDKGRDGRMDGWKTGC